MHGIKKVLCLHGYGMNGLSFHRKLQAIEKIAKLAHPDLQFVVPNGTEKLSEENIREMFANILTETEGRTTIPLHGEHYRWMNSKRVKPNSEERNYTGLDDTIKYLTDLNETEGPFTGILGFSQGGCVSSMLASLSETKDLPMKFKFVVSICGFTSNDRKYDDLFAKSLMIPAMVVNYNQDPIYPKPQEVFNNLTSAFGEDNKVAVLLDGRKHQVPTDESTTQLIGEFIASHI